MKASQAYIFQMQDEIVDILHAGGVVQFPVPAEVDGRQYVK